MRRRRWLALLDLALAHHTRSRLSRTIGFRVLGWEQRFCTRCSGQWLAAAACIALMLAFGWEVPFAVRMTVLSLLPMPAFLDWLTQTWGIRESSTFLRLLTGSMLGLGVGLQVVAGARFDWLAFTVGIGVAAGYSLAIYLMLRLRPPPAGYMADLVEEATKIVDNSRGAG